ncbi:MAG: hypothetical protein P8Q48_20570 [Paracoccaceae bacterium]|nr:hypothetical protein [Paracoccaceae bacterium]
MYRPLQIAVLATLLATFSFYLWRISFTYSDWAILALIPLTVIIVTSIWPLTLDPWKARLDIALRNESTWKKWLTGRLRTILLSSVFTLGSVTLLAWQALRASTIEAALMLIIFFVSALSYSFGQRLLLRHFRQPFARAFATSLVTWCLAVPATIGIAVLFWNFAVIPGRMMDASFQEALQIGLLQLPPRDGWLSNILSVLFGYEAAKIWVVVQLRDYQVLGWIFSLDSALFSFILCRTSIIVAQFVEVHVLTKNEV